MPFELTDVDGVFIVKLARKAVTEYVRRKERVKPPLDTPSILKTKCGVFVTLNRVENESKELRGCIGYPEPTMLLVEATLDSAVNAAVADPRFPPVSEDELGSIVVEVSVLTPLELIKVRNPKDYPKHVRIGVDGLVVERRWNRGLLLPQVPVEWGWDEEEFLGQCCMKAGLPPDSWLVPETRIYRFQAIIYAEETPGGEIRRVSLKRN